MSALVGPTGAGKTSIISLMPAILRSKQWSHKN